MTPVIGHWYNISRKDDYSPKNSYYGKAKCVGRQELSDGWWFKKFNKDGWILYKAEDVVEQTTRPLSRRELEDYLRRLASSMYELCGLIGPANPDRVRCEAIIAELKLKGLF